MNKDRFKQTMLNVLKYDSKFKDKENRLFPLLLRTTVNNLPQYEFRRCGRSGQRYENIELRVPVTLIDEANEIKKDLSDLVKYVYEESDDYGLGKVLICPQILHPDNVEYKEHDVFFSGIQDKIIQGIRDAKYTIWAAVAWFSNQAIIDELSAKKKQGVNIRLVISEEESNKEFYHQLSEKFDTVIIPHFGFERWNRMHHKFCIIDFDYVMHGCYNWTKSANYNDETLEISLDRDLVKKFADEFMRLYNKRKNFIQY